MLDKNKKKKALRKEIYIVASLFVVVFGAMIGYFVKFVNTDSKDFIYNAYNSRFSVFSDDVVRGSIYTADGNVIAETKINEDGDEVRVYPDERLFCHSVGYVGQGMAGLEAQYTFDLLKSNIELSDQIDNSLAGIKNPGDNLYTTFDYDTQLAAFDGLGMYDGAVIAIEPDTGKIIAMVSKPDYDPNTIAKYWDDITDSSKNKSSLVNRAIQGAYPPGSTFKIVTTIAYLRANDGDSEFEYKCTGSINVDDYKIHCSGNKSHGTENLLKAFSYSCNSAYASIGIDLDRQEFSDTAQDLLFNQTLPTMLESTKKSSFTVDSSTSETVVAQTAIGQGNTTVSPLHMCMLVSAIANDGILMEPYMVDRIVSEDGNEVSKTEPVEYGQLISNDEAELLQSYMAAVVEEGTAEKVDFGDLTVYGKTGTAEYSDDKSVTHSWFVGYAVGENGKKLAVAVIMESAGYGSKYAAPLASKVFEAYFE